MRAGCGKSGFRIQLYHDYTISYPKNMVTIDYLDSLILYKYSKILQNTTHAELKVSMHEFPRTF